MPESRQKQNEWVSSITGWLARNNIDIEKIQSATVDTEQRVRLVAEAIVRYTADTQTNSFEQFVRLATQWRDVALTQRPSSDWLAQTADSLIVLADGENRPKKAPTPRNEHVILLHGLSRRALSMVRIEQNLLNRGFSVSNIDYPSTQDTIEELVDGYIVDRVAEIPTGIRKVHFVTHSMGGILVRYFLKEHSFERLGRVVMLAPPNRGSELIDLLGDNPLWQLMAGPAGQQLGTRPESLPNKLGPVDFELGVIMGTKTISPLLSTMLPGANDGKVTVERAKIDGMRDLLLEPTNHTFIMQEPSVIDQIVYFLVHGEFDRSDVVLD